MGLIFDIHTARQYDAWRQSSYGIARERLAEKAILDLLEPQPGERVLDIGCGTGNRLLFFSKLGLGISGIDASPYMINRARERLGNRCCLKTGKAEDLPFDDNEFDLAVLDNTLEFLDEPVRALTEAGRVANRRVYIGVMNSLSWPCLRNKFQSYFRSSLFNQMKFYSLWELKSLVLLAFGNVPIVWRSSFIYPPFLNRFEGFFTGAWNLEYHPFGSFLGLAATILYRVKTDNVPLKIRMKEAGESIVPGMTLGDLKHEKDNNLPQQRRKRS